MKRAMINKKLLSLITVTAVGFTMTCAPAFAETKNVKEETVYVITDSTGDATETIVSDHLKNKKNDKTLNDESNLSNIENVKGDEKFKTEGNTVTWDANGNDIYYQGNTDKSAPVTMDITYYLNGTKISGKDLQGKSGSVKIKIKYHNDATVNGTKVPFIVMTGLMADSDTFKNIEIDNGKIIDSGSSNIVVGMAAPGLKESLNINSDKLKLGDEVTIKGTADKFDCENMMTIVTNSLYEDIDTSEIDDLDFDDDINALDKASKKLVEGTRQLYDGINYMNGQSGTLVSGVSQLNDGATAVKEGTDEALEGNLKLQAGINQVSQKLAQSLQAICDNLDTISGTAGKVKTGLNDVKSGVDSALDSAASYAGAASSDASAASSEAQSAAGEVSTVKSKVSEAKSALSSINTEGMTDDQKAAIESAKSKIEDAASAADSMDGNISNAASNAGKAAQEAGGAKDYASGAKDKLDGAIGSTSSEGTLLYAASAIKAGADQMKSTIEESTSTGDLAQGLKALSEGSDKLVTRETKLNDGAKKLANGMTTLNDSTGELVDGIGQLDDGSKQLKDGMAKYYKQGIKELVNMYNKDLKGTLNNLDDVLDAGKDYDSFTKVSSDMDSSVSFVYKTEISK